MATEIEVAVGVLAERRNGRIRVLIGRRPDGQILGGYWEFPGGKRRDGESLEQCLVREFQEELSLTVQVTSDLPVVKYSYEYGNVLLSPFLCRRLGGQVQDIAVSEHRWIDPLELNSYRFPPANGPLLDHLVRMMGAPQSKWQTC